MVYNKNEIRITFFRLTLLVISAVWLTACGGGSGDQQSDPTVQDFPIAYVKRPAPTNAAGNQISRDYRDVTNFSPGAVLYVKRQATISSPAIDVSTREIGSTGDVKDVEISLDGTKVLFAMKEEDDDTDTDEETWNIWEYTIATDTLSRIITSGLVAEEADDVDPHYLVDGRIIFSTTRQVKSINILTKEAFNNTVSKSSAKKAVQDNSDDLIFNIHVMADDGLNIRQVTYNQGHDLDPSLMDDGRILFTRWDIVGPNNAFNLYTMNPDGSDTKLLYGTDSHATGTDGDTIQFTEPREMQDGRVLVLTRPFDNTFDGGDLVAIDVNSYVDNTRPVALTPTLTGPAQVKQSQGTITTAPGISAGGRYSSAYPFWDGTGRMLVSYSACALDINNQLITAGDLSPCTTANLADPLAVEVAPRYGLFVWDPTGTSLLPVVQPLAPVPDPEIPDAFIYYYFTDAVVAQDRAMPTNIVDATDEFAAEQTGIIHIKSVYDFGTSTAWGFSVDATATIADIRNPLAAPLYANHPARFIRIVKAVSLPSTDDLDLDPDAFGVTGANGMREIVGYVPIEPDGSAKFKVPADVPVALSILDEKGRRISERHNNWITVRNGETLECIGCHTRAADALNNVHGRRDAEEIPRNTGATADGATFTNTLNTFDTDIVFGLTMAEVRNPDDTSTNLYPTLDITYTDVWTNPASGATALGAINYLYDDVYDFADAAEAKPVSTTCKNNWEDPCRVIINYSEHIAPVWSRDRGAGVTCIECHSDTDGTDPMIPEAQLDLDDTAQSPDPDGADNFLESYAELFQSDTALFVDAMGNLVAQKTDGAGNLLFTDNLTGLETTDATDADDNPNTAVVITAPGVVMSPNGARSSYFMQKMSGDALGFADRGNTEDHTAMMSASELKLIAEWLDIGAQYYNNPFATGVPTE